MPTYIAGIKRGTEDLCTANPHSSLTVDERGTYFSFYIFSVIQVLWEGGQRLCVWNKLPLTCALFCSLDFLLLLLLLPCMRSVHENIDVRRGGRLGKMLFGGDRLTIMKGEISVMNSLRVAIKGQVYEGERTLSHTC